LPWLTALIFAIGVLLVCLTNVGWKPQPGPS
jgi:hypothetical protein